MRVQFAPELRAAEIERAVAALVAEACATLPDVITLYVSPCAAAPLCADDDAVAESS
jgi:hypothetical protein